MRLLVSGQYDRAQGPSTFAKQVRRPFFVNRLRTGKDVMANFSATLDRQTIKDLDRIARFMERKKSDAVRVLIREKARELVQKTTRPDAAILAESASGREQSATDLMA
jgi:hypothetical protein